ncbi:MAG: hypothetical protein HYX68_28765 [Planctomycetes bacterium]|nr:hypothetical protein [Planctomycetota bacterium]
MNRFKKTFRPEVETLESREVMNATFSLSGGVLTITSDNYGDVLNVRQNGAAITINGKRANPTSAVSQIVVHGNGGNDVIDLRNVSVKAIVYGGAGNDRIIGGLAANYPDGGDHNDILLGLSGNDSLLGGDGHDRLFGNGGYDYLYGEDGTDFLDDGNRAAQETMYGGDGADFSADTWTINGATTGDIVQGQSLACTFLASLAAGADSGINYSSWIRYVGYDTNYMPFYQVRFLHLGK